MTIVAAFFALSKAREILPEGTYAASEILLLLWAGLFDVVILLKLASLI